VEGNSVEKSVKERFLNNSIIQSQREEFIKGIHNVPYFHQSIIGSNETMVIMRKLCDLRKVHLFFGMEKI
jgi:hypothetical protein